MMKKMGKIFLYILAGSLIAVSLVPLALSTSFGKNALVAIANSKIDGKLEIGELSIGWLTSQKIIDLKLSRSNGERIVSVHEISSDESLLSILFSGRFKALKISDADVTIVQDGSGATNLEGALGIKPFSNADLRTPAYLEKVNIELKTNPDRALFAKGVGLTRQNDLKGQFFLDVSLGTDRKVNFRAENFPVLLLDQTVSISNNDLSGVLLDLLGESIDVTLDGTSGEEKDALVLFGKSKTLSVEVKGQIHDGILTLFPSSKASLNLSAENASSLLSKFADKQILFTNPLQADLSLESFQFPLEQKNSDALIGRFELDVKPNGAKFEDQEISWKELRLSFDAPKTSPDVALRLTLNANYETLIGVDVEAKVAKEALLSQDTLQVLSDGIKLQGKITEESIRAKVAFQGVLKQENTNLKFTLASDKGSIEEALLIIHEIPFAEIFEDGTLYSDLEGVITLKHPHVVTEQDADLSFIDEVTIPWTLDSEGNSLKIAFTGIKETGQPRENVKGTLRIDSWKKEDGINLSEAPIQLNLKLHGFDAEKVQSFIPEHPVSAALGREVDADITAIRDESGNIKGSIDLNIPKNSDAFLKKLTADFAMQNEGRDITFTASSHAALGATQFSGTFHNLFDGEGKLQVDKASISVKGSLRHFPVALITRLATGDSKLAAKMEAVLGSQVDAEIYAEIKDRKGPISLKLKGINGNLSLNGGINQGILTLSEPLTASLKVTPQLEQVVLREMLPILSSVVSAEKPIELVIPKEGFRMNISFPSLSEINIQNGSLSLNKMQFGRDSELGKIVRLLGVNQNTFQVWFTPVYFNLQNGALSMARVDMLIADAYPLASWGEVNFEKNRLSLVVGLSGHALKKAFKIKGITSKYMLQIPVRGAVNKPEIDLAKGSARISALVAESQIPQGKLIGTVVNAATDIVTNERTPAPSTNPLPWEGSLEELPDEPGNPVQEAIDIPVDELKKGAKKLLKGIFGG